MSSVASENGCATSEDLNGRKNLKSAVISDNDPLKIKLKISKRDISDVKPGKVQRVSSSGKSELNNGDEKSGEDREEDRLPKSISVGDPKMKLRSNKEADDEPEQNKEEIEEGTEEKRKRKELLHEKEEKPIKKRLKSMRLQGEENVEKVEEGTRRRSRRNESDTTVVEKTKEVVEEFKNIRRGSFCWTCHKDNSVVKCDTCPRVFHLKCVSLTKDPSKDWICPECSLVLHAEKISTRSEAMKSLSLDQLCTLLSFAIGRMKNVPESQAFWKPVDLREVPFYDKYITNPMDLNLLERNMKAKMYGSPQAFLADAKWLLHNSIIFNTTQSPLTSTARLLVKICRQEMAEIENCPDCYLNAHTKDNWFIEVCRKPHILIWARLKGFPFWPAKAMSTNLKTQQVDARFFGAHDKAWVPVKECYLYSKTSPQVISKKRTDLDDAFLEAEGYIKKIRQKFGTFCYASDKTPFMPEMYDKQLQSMIPNYKEEKSMKKKRKVETPSGENGEVEKRLQNGKKATETCMSPRLKLKRPPTEDSSKVVGDFCVISDYVSEEKVVNEEGISPEDEVARSLEMFDTHKKGEREAEDDNSVDVEEEGSVHIPEHGYSRSINYSGTVQSSSTENQVEDSNLEATEKEDILISEVIEEEEIKNECFAKNIEKENIEKISLPEIKNDQCEVSSTSSDLKVIESEDQEAILQTNSQPSPDEEKLKDQSTSLNDCDKTDKEKSNSGSAKKDDDKTQKSFVNLSCDQKQKILTEAKLLANIDEMTALGKQKVLNDLGLDGSQVDIHQLAQENRQILETLTKKCQNERKGFEEVSIKNEDFEQYLIEENSERTDFDDIPPVASICGSIKVRDFQSLSKTKSCPSGPGNICTEPMLKIRDVQSLRDLQQLKEPKRKKSSEDPASSKRLKFEPVIKLFKLDSYDNSVEKLNRKLRLSDEVSLLMVDGEKKTDVESVKPEPVKTSKKAMKPPRARKSMPNKAKILGDANKNINVISVDTENSTAQKNLLKSLCLEEKKPDDLGRKTVLITTNEKGIQNVDVKSLCEPSLKKQIQEVTIEAVKDSGKGSEIARDGNMTGQKSLTVVADSHLIVTNNGPAIVTNQATTPNLAFTQNNLGQLSLVHLSNLTSGIQTNFINLANETIGFNNSIGTLYASPTFNAEFPTSSASVILSPNLTTTPVAAAVAAGSPTAKGSKSGGDLIKLSVNRVGAGKSSSGISVKSPASLGLVTSQPSKLPPVVTVQGDGIPLVGEVGSVTAELNSHSMKMAEYMKAIIEDLLRDLSNQGSLEAKCKLLTIEMEKLQWKHQQEIMELKQHSERSLIELRNTLESEKQKCLGELKAQLDCHHQKVISETKRKQWCANCGKEALFYCCWNTSYCDYPCQQQHWPGHMSTCAQLGNNAMGNSAGSQLQSKTPGIKYQNSTYVPIISRGGGSGGNNGGSGTHSGAPFTANRALPTVQAQSSQSRRSSDPSTPQLPINITIRPQHYFM